MNIYEHRNGNYDWLIYICCLSYFCYCWVEKLVKQYLDIYHLLRSIYQPNLKSISAGWNFAEIFGVRKQCPCAIVWRCLRDPMLSRFGSWYVPVCDGRKDTVRHLRQHILYASKASRGKNGYAIRIEWMNENARILSAFENRLRAGFV